MLPSELFQAHTAVEYVLSQPVMAPPAFVIVVDLAGDAADLEVGPGVSSWIRARDLTQAL